MKKLKSCNFQLLWSLQQKNDSNGGDIRIRIAVTCQSISCYILKTRSCCSQVAGEYENVERALFQITGRLRDHFFFSTTPEEADPRNSSNPYSADEFNRPGFRRKVGGPHKPSLQGKQVMLVPSLFLPSVLFFPFICSNFF